MTEGRTWQLSDDVERYLAAAGHLLDPVRHTVALTVAQEARTRPDGTRFGWWTAADGTVTGAVSQTPPFPLLLAVVPDEAIRPLVEALDPQAVNGPSSLAAQVAAIAAQRTGADVLLRRADRLHHLGTLTPPTGVPGAARIATPADLPVVQRWFEAFVGETGVIAGDLEVMVRHRIAGGALMLWDDNESGGPVAMAGRRTPAFGCVRLGPVYTPPEHRTIGYAGAATSAVAQQSLDDGARDVVLFTDLTNPTSNALYNRLGFSPVCDSLLLDLRAPGGAATC